MIAARHSTTNKRLFGAILAAALQPRWSETILAASPMATELPDQTGKNDAPADIQWMPPGAHTIEASKGGKPVTKEITVTAATATKMQAVLAAMNAAADRGEGDRPYFDFNHEDGPASAHPTEFYWGGDDLKTGGVRAKVAWTDGGKQAVLGRAYRRFSPAFFADDTGNVTGAPPNMGGLVNSAAFQKISPLWARHGADPAGDQQHTIENPVIMKSLIALLAKNGVVTSAEVDEATAISQVTTYLATQATQKADIEVVKGQLTTANDNLVKARKAHAESVVEAAIKAGRLPSKNDAIKARWTALIEADPKNEELLPAVDPALQRAVNVEGREDGASIKAKKNGEGKVHPFIAKAREIRKNDESIKSEADAQAVCARLEPGLYNDYRESLFGGGSGNEADPES